MSLKIPVEDRKSTYPGRVVLTPVAGETNTYDMTRADVPINEGTPINKELFDSKAYTLTEDVTVHVSPEGNDLSGDGSVEAPFQTIQKAVDAIPKHLGGFTAHVNIDWGVYAERVVVEGFGAGKLILGTDSASCFIQGGIDINSCSNVELRISQIEALESSSVPLIDVTGGSNVFIRKSLTLDAKSLVTVGLRVNDGSVVSADDVAYVTISNCTTIPVIATYCSLVSFGTIKGSGNMFGMSATRGGIISFTTDELGREWSNLADSGGLILTGNNSSDLSDATLDL